MSKGSNSPSRRPRTFSPNDPNLYLVPNIKGDFNDPSNDGTGYGALSAAEQNQTYFAYFDGIGGTGPEIIDQTAYFIKYLIDTEGNIVNPEPDNIGLINLIDNFEPGKRAVVQASSATNTNLIGGPFNITGVGRISPILITETGSGRLDYARTMSFVGPAGDDITANISNYYFLRKKTSDEFVFNTSFDVMSFGTVTNAGGDGGTSTSTIYTVNTDTVTGGTPIAFETRFVLRNEAAIAIPGILPTNAVTIRIESSIDNFSTFNVEATQTQTLPWNAIIPVIVTTPFKNFPANAKLRVRYRFANGGSSAYNVKIFGVSSGTNTYFKSLQSYPSVTGEINGVNIATSSFWSVGTYLTGSEITMLTASTALTSLYQAGVIQSASTAITSFGFSIPTLPVSDIAVGDYIRFEYNKNYVHNITEVTNTVDGNLALKVVPPVISGSILDHFVLYRIVNDGTYVILDVKKNSAGSFSGILQPEYISQELKDKYSDIIQKLTLEGVIT